MNLWENEKKMNWLHPVIMGGGKGQRLWPLSTTARAKQFLQLVGKQSLIRQAYDRLTKTKKITKNQIFFSTSQEQKQNIIKEFPHIAKKEYQQQIIIEPFVRDTACAMLLAAMHVQQQKSVNERDVLFFLPADAAINKNEIFFNDITLAAKVAQTQPSLVLLGIKPTRPATNYGYLQTQKLTKKEQKEWENTLPAEILRREKVQRVSQFVEKPKIDVARQYLKRKNYLWNSGMFFIQCEFLIKLFQKHAKSHYRLVSEYLQWEKEKNTEKARECFLKIKKISFDFAIAEKMKESIYVVPSSIEWDDLGTLSSLARVMPLDKKNNMILGNAYQMDCENVLCDARQSHKKIVLHNLKDAVVVATPDTTYISNKSGAEDIKKLLAQLKKDDLDSLL